MNEFITHVESQHELPVWSNADVGFRPIVQAFDETLAIHQLDVDDHGIPDIFNVMITNKAHIERIVQDRVRKGPQKVQFNATVELFKPVNDDSEEQKRLEVHINSHVETNYSDGLKEETFTKCSIQCSMFWLLSVPKVVAGLLTILTKFRLNLLLMRLFEDRPM